MYETGSDYGSDHIEHVLMTADPPFPYGDDDD
jgi:hypothetical protein